MTPIGPPQTGHLEPWKRYVHVHFTPTSPSWLNMVERWFATLTQKQIQRGAHRRTRALETEIREYLLISNDSSKPFVWHKTADEILASVVRYCQNLQLGTPGPPSLPLASHLGPRASNENGIKRRRRRLDLRG